MWRRWIIIGAALTLTAARIIFPKLNIDSTSVWLIAVAAILFVLPEILPFVKKIKMGGTEVELRDKIRKADEDIKQAQTSLTKNKKYKLPSSLNSEIKEVMNVTKESPQAALLLLSSKLEAKIRNRLEKAKVITGNQYISLPKAVKLGTKEGVFSHQTYSAFLDFYMIRNKVAHGEAFQVNESSVLSLISIGVELLRLLSAEEALAKERRS